MIALIDYGAGNVASVSNALSQLKYDFVITQNEAEIIRADKIIFPGVGEASFAMRKLHLLNLFSVLRMCVKPMLGICLGLQLMVEKSEEGNVACLGVFPGKAKKFDDTKIKVPHMGWNKVEFIKESKLFTNIKSGTRFYFANSFYVPVNKYTTAKSEHDVQFTAAMEKENFYGVQFHPEKSSDAGIQLLKNFIELC